MLRRVVAFAALSLALVSPTHAAVKPWTFDDVIALRPVHDPQVSPDGRYVVYVVSELAPDTSRYQSDLWLGTIATGEQRRLTTNPVNDESPQWSPDGRSIAFLSERPLTSGKASGMQVWSLSLDGGEAVPLTSAENGVTSFQWRGDGRAIAYASPEGATASGRSRAAGKDDAWVASEHPGATRVWLQTLGAERGEPLTPSGVFVSGFTLAPKGDRLVYAVQNEPGSNGTYTSDLWSLTLPSGRPTPLVQRPGMDNRPAFSPDGRTIAFLSSNGLAAGNADNVSVCIIPATGGAVTDLTPDFDERIGGGNTNTGPTWSGDGRSVMFVSCKRTNVGVFRAFLEQRSIEALFPEDGVGDAPSSDTSARVLAWVHEDATHPAEVWVWDMARGVPRAFTDLNPWTRERASFPAEVVTWRGADGQPVEGLLYRPLAMRAGARVPLLLYVHGGPAANHATYFTPSLDMQGLAHYLQTGWAVLLPNPRGSAGYGLAWRRANTRDWGDKPFVDLMTGVDTLIARGLVDSTRMAVCGWSYGGYMTANIVGLTNRFKAAVAGAGPVDLISMTGTCDVPTLLHSAMRAWPWEDPAIYAANSPLSRVTNVRTPTAFVHGGADARVPPTQSWEMFRALRTLGVPTDLMILPRSPHAPEEPRQLRTFMEWNHAWLARWTLTTSARPTR